MKKKYLICLFFCEMTALISAAETKGLYDPLQICDPNQIRIMDMAFTDERRNRAIPLRIYLPSSQESAAVVLFSHGLGGSREGCAYLGKHWAGRGYVAVFVQHPGSDTSVWKDTPRSERLQAMNKAANGKNFMFRVKDIPAVLDQLERWNTTEGHALQTRLDLRRVGMSGHSFGAVTTQAVSGQALGAGRQLFTDQRIKAAIAFSPSSPRLGNPEQAFSKVRIPWMLMTGTKDLAMIGDADMESRLAVFPALPPGDKYEVVLYNAEHSAFTESALPGESELRNPNHHRVILALSTAFWDAYLNNNPDAKLWLNTNGPARVLEKQDRWQKK